MKKILLILTLLLTLAAPMRAQVFIMEEDEGPDRNVLGANGTYNNVIVHGSSDDQTNYVPIGNGVLLLAAMGGAYLVGRRKKVKANKKGK